MRKIRVVIAKPGLDLRLVDRIDAGSDDLGRIGGEVEGHGQKRGHEAGRALEPRGTVGFGIANGEDRGGHEQECEQRILEAATAETPKQGGRSQTYRLQAATLALSNRAPGAATESVSGYERAGG